VNPLQQLSDYLRRLERNLRLLTLARGSAVLFGAALVITLALVLIMNQLSFSDPSVFYSRVVLFLILAAALSAALISPLLRMNQKRAAREAERRHPELGERLLTFVERRNAKDPFLPLLAADSLSMTSAAGVDTIAAPSRALAFGSLALMAALVLLWLGMRGPGYFGYGTSLLWGVSKEETKPFYSVTLQPGNQRVRRHSDQIVSAHLNGFFSHQASLFVRYASATKWEETAMRPQPDAAGFQFLLVGLPEDVDYYVVSNDIHSATAKLTAVDLPQVTHLSVTYHFPAIYGRKDETEDPGGDLRAIQGTVAALDIETDKPLSVGSIVLDSGAPIELTGSGTLHHASVPIEKDGAYHIATVDGGQTVRLSDDYFIEARRDSPPVISILRPNRDARATPIEEVPVELQARDDNGVMALDLHYSVNGGPEQTRSVLSSRGSKDTRGTAMLSLEEFKLTPGDIVTVYGTARDAKTTARSDIYFIEARPFELSYHQEQSSGSGSGGQDDPKIAERQKEIIAATFNQLKDEKRVAATDAENAKYLSGVQAKLKDEAQSLANRVKARQIAGNNSEFQQFIANMESAVSVMGPASDELKGQKWHDALSPEQKALQYLLRAESIFRDIQVQISKGGGGGGGGGGASRDLEGLTSLELDTQKNQYESGSQSAADQKQKEADEALKKLEELAKRQQELAQQQQQSKQNFQQRWEQEMLRREAEQLRQKLEDLARNKQKDSQQQGEQGDQGQESSQGEQGQQAQGQQGQQGSGKGQQASGQQASGQSGAKQQASKQQASGSAGGKFSPGTQQALEQALQNLTEAEKRMGDAASHGDPSQAQRAAEELNRAESSMSQMRHQQNGSEMGDVLDQARKLADKQKSFDERLRHNFAGGASGNRSDKQNEQLSAQMSDEKRREIDDLHQLEHTLQQAARGMQNTQPDAAKKLRDAIGEMQQNELESRMRWTMEALNKGLGSYAVMREAPVTRELDDLKDKLRDAESAMGAGSKAGSGDEAMQQALARARKLSKDLHAMAGDRPGGDEGSKPGQGKDGKTSEGKSGQPGKSTGNSGEPSQASTGQAGQQPGQQAGEQAGQQPGQQGGQQPGQRSGTSSAGSFGPVGPAGSGSWDAMNTGNRRPPDAATAQREYEEAVRELGRLGQSVSSDPATAKDMQNLLRDLQHLDPRRFQADPQKLAALEQQILADAEQAELILRRKLDEAHGSIRTTSPQNIPPGYGDAVAEYFRRLSH
jgi:hypothetical protein